MSPLLPYFAVFLTLCLWASSFVGIRVALEFWSPGGLAFLRYVVASLALLLLVPFFKLGDRFRFNKSDFLLFSTFALLGVVGYHVGLNLGEQTVTAGTASFIVGQIPLVTLLLNSILFRGQVSVRGAFGIVLGVIGTGLIFFAQGEGVALNIGILWVVMAVISESLYFVLQKPALERFTPFGLNFYTNVFGMLLLIPFAFKVSGPTPEASGFSVLLVVYLGVFPAAVAYLLWSYAIQELGVVTTSMSLYALPAITVFMAALLINEMPNSSEVLGGTIALLGAYLCSAGTTGNSKQSKRKQDRIDED